MAMLFKDFSLTVKNYFEKYIKVLENRESY